METPDTPSTAAALVVCGDPGLCRILQWTLEDEGLQVIIARDAAAARAALSAAQPGLLLIDLPRDPRDEARLVRHVLRRYADAVPIILVALNHERVDALHVDGRCRYLRKPFEIDALTATVRSAISGPPGH